MSRLTRFVGAENMSLIIALLLMVLAVSSQTEFLFSSRNIFNIFVIYLQVASPRRLDSLCPSG